MSLVVVKVGGSLYDLPDLGARLRDWLASRPRFLVVAGGGVAADAVRTLDEIHALGPTVSHWLALRACSVTAHFLAGLIGLPIVDVAGTANGVVDLFAFADADEVCPDRWPHSWDVTSDSMAVRVAHVAGAEELVLLKSCDFVGDDWDAAARTGVVDPFFPRAMAKSRPLRARVINFREAVSP